MKVMLINGKKCYPTARWETSAHKVNYWLQKYQVKLESWYFTGEELTAHEEETLQRRVEYLEGLMERYQPMEDGFVYLPYPDYKAVREMIAEYDARH